MEQGEAEETLRSLERLRSATAAKARSWSTPLFAWAFAVAGSILVCELVALGIRRASTTIVQDGVTGTIETSTPSSAKEAVAHGVYWLVAATVATIVSVRSYREQAVHAEPRPPMSSTDKIILFLLLVFFAPGAFAALVLMGAISGTWPFLIASVWMMILGKLIRNHALNRVAMYSILVVPLAASVADHGCTIAAGAYTLSLGITAEVLRRKEKAA